MSRQKISSAYILTILSYVITLIIIFLPEVQRWISNLPLMQRIIFILLFFLLPSIPILIVQREEIYCALCRLFKLSDEEKVVLAMIWSRRSRKWNLNELSKVLKEKGYDMNEETIQKILKRLESRRLIDITSVREGITNE